MIAFGAAGVFGGPRAQPKRKTKYPYEPLGTNEQKVLHVLEDLDDSGIDLTCDRITVAICNLGPRLTPRQVGGAIERLKKQGLVRITSDRVYGPTVTWGLTS